MIERTCDIDGCGRPHEARGWCHRHYLRWLAHGDPLITLATPRSLEPAFCSIDGCDRPHLARGWCNTHWKRWRRHGDPLGTTGIVQTRGRTGHCAVQDCDKEDHARGLCRTHYSRWQRHGDPMHGGPVTPAAPRSETRGYIASHDLVKKARNAARTHPCVDCGEQAREWSYDHADPNEATETHGRYAGRLYSLDVNHYAPRCNHCHRAFDDAPRELSDA